MTREEMLKELKALDCRIFWPGNWKDVGFTESQMWVNGKGYGLFSCDEPNITYMGISVPTDKWRAIRERIKDGTLLPSDIEGTALAEMHFFDNDDAYSSEWLKNLLSLPDELSDDGFYCADDWEGPCFFSNEDDFLDFLKRDWCDEYWDDLDDEVLTLWVQRLHAGALEWDV